MRAAVHDLWCVWELMGDTDGLTRGRMRDAIVETKLRGWELARAVTTVGSDGWWSHSMAFWRLSGHEALTESLSCNDGLDEHAFRWGKATLYQRLRGDLTTDHGALLMEYVRAADPETLTGLAGPDLLLSDLFAPWQGLALFGAENLAALAARE